MSNLPYYYCTTADSNTPQDIGSSKQKSSSGDKEQRTTVYAPGPAPNKPTAKHDDTCKLSRVSEYGYYSSYSPAIVLFL